jgi:choline dehydrogenase-like flavoprotein
MGPPEDPRAVVDPELRVYGVSNLRVADLSVMPEAISGNTHAPCVMIGEKVSEMIKRDHGLRKQLNLEKRGGGVAQHVLLKCTTSTKLHAVSAAERNLFCGAA